MSLVLIYLLMFVIFLIIITCVFIIRKELFAQMEHSRTINYHLKNPTYKYNSKVNSLTGILFMRVYTFIKNIIY